MILKLKTLNENQQVQTTFSPRESRQWISDIISLLVLLFIFYLFCLGNYPLFTPDEGRYSEVAREMITSGDYITPRVNGVVFLDKPILHYWMQAAAMHLFGVTEWATRFFPALLGMLGCVATYVGGRYLFDRRTGLLSALILAASPLYFGGAHYANLDLEVAVFISCTLLCFICGAQSTGRVRMVFLFSMYIFAALAVLTKGLIGIAFPALIASCWILICRRFDVLRKIYLFSGIFLFAALVLPWYALVQQANPGFLHFFFVTQHVTRFLSTADFNNKTTVWFYVPVMLGGFLPWTLFLVHACIFQAKNVYSIVSSPRRRGSIQMDPRLRGDDSVCAFLLLWVTIIFIFFSIPHSKIITYILPIFPALALLVGNYISESSRKSRAMLPLFAVCFICSVSLLIVIALNAPRLNQNTAKPLITQLQSILKPDDEVANYFKFYQDTPFYLQREITLVANWNSPAIIHKDNWIRELWFGMTAENTRDRLISEDIFWQRWHSQKRMFVFVNDNYVSQFKAHTKRYVLLGKHNDIFLFGNY